MERYWHRKRYELDLQIKMNPFIQQGKEKQRPVIDATTDDGLEALIGKGFKVKEI